MKRKSTFLVSVLSTSSTINSVTGTKIFLNSSLSASSWAGISLGIIVILIIVIVSMLFYHQRKFCFKSLSQNKPTDKNPEIYSCIDDASNSPEDRHPEIFLETNTEMAANAFYHSVDPVANGNTAQRGLETCDSVLKNKSSNITENILYDGNQTHEM